MAKLRFKYLEALSRKNKLAKIAHLVSLITNQSVFLTLCRVSIFKKKSRKACSILEVVEESL